MERNLQESQEHSALIGMMVRHFANQGLRNIKADMPSMPTPDIINGTRQNHRPDLTAEKNGVTVILEAETGSTITSEHTASQWSLFSDAAQKAGGEFHVVVPKGCRGSAEERVAALGINIKTIWTPT